MRFKSIIILLLFTIGILFSGCVLFPQNQTEQKSILEIGTKVIITKDVRDVDDKLDGKEAGFIGYEENEAWILFDENGNPTRESYTLPEGYIEWDNEKEKFPKQKCGIKSGNPIFRTDSGEEINGGQCYWEPKDPELKKRIIDKGNELLRKAKG